MELGETFMVSLIFFFNLDGASYWSEVFLAALTPSSY